MIKKVSNVGFALDTIVKFQERIYRNQDWVAWGEDNKFVDGLYDLLDYSPIHNACVRSKIDNVVGQGFVTDYKTSDKETLNDTFIDMVYDYIITGNIFLEVVWKKDRSQGLSGLHHIPSKYVRVGKPEDEEFTIQKYYYCRDWSNHKKMGVIEFDNFDPYVYTNRQIVHIRSKNPGYWAYGSPEYLSIINDIRLNHEITVFNLAELVNGAYPGLWIHFNDGSPSSETEERKILQQIEQRFGGSKNAGKVTVSYSDGPEGKPDITQIQNNLQQGFYQEIFELVQRQILAGHKIPDGSLIGLPSPSGFSSQADLLNTAQKLYLKTSIIPIQNFLLREIKPLVELVNKDESVKLIINQNTEI